MGGEAAVHRSWMRIKRRLHERRLWAKARTLEDLGELTAQWLEGGIAYQPGYYGPCDVDEDLAPGMRDTLVRLNRAGFVTNSSQAGYDNASWTSHAAVTGFARDEVVQRLRPTLQRVGYVAVTDDYSDKPGGTHVTFQDGRPYTAFGGPLDKQTIEEIYPGGSAAAIDDLCGQAQLTVYDPQTGRNTLWAALDEGVNRHEQENAMTSPSYDDAPRDSVRPGLHNAPGTSYNHDPRVKADGSGGYTVTPADGIPRSIRYDEHTGWAMYADGGDEPVTGSYAAADDVIGVVLGAAQCRDEAGDIHECQPEDGPDRSTSPAAEAPESDHTNDAKDSDVNDTTDTDEGGSGSFDGERNVFDGGTYDTVTFSSGGGGHGGGHGRSSSGGSRTQTTTFNGTTTVGAASFADHSTVHGHVNMSDSVPGPASQAGNDDADGW